MDRFVLIYTVLYSIIYFKLLKVLYPETTNEFLKVLERIITFVDLKPVPIVRLFDQTFTHEKLMGVANADYIKSLDSFGVMVTILPIMIVFIIFFLLIRCVPKFKEFATN